MNRKKVKTVKIGKILLIFYAKAYIIEYIWRILCIAVGCIIDNKDNKGGETLARD